MKKEYKEFLIIYGILIGLSLGIIWIVLQAGKMYN